MIFILLSLLILNLAEIKRLKSSNKRILLFLLEIFSSSREMTVINI